MLQLRAVYALSSIAVVCFACLLLLLKAVRSSECADSTAEPGGSILHPIVITCLAAAALVFIASATCFVKLRAWARASSFCAKWQPLYFIAVSVQKVVLRAIGISYSVQPSGSCLYDVATAHDNSIQALLFIWNCTILLAGVSTICCDFADFSRDARRCAYGLLAVSLLLDAIGSFKWGNAVNGEISLSVANVSFLLDNQITSSIASQLVMAVHFLFVSCRSIHGRGWSYASLRFEYDEPSDSSISRHSLQHADHLPNVESSSASSNTPMLKSQSSLAASQKHTESVPNSFARLRQRWLQFQMFHVSRCRVFLIPRVTVQRAAGDSRSKFAMARPVFDVRCMRPLQRLADAHPTLYISVAFVCLGVPCIACQSFLRDTSRAVSTLALNSCLLIVLLGFISSKRHGLDRVAVKHVASSFRFAALSALLAQWVLLNSRQAYQGAEPAAQPAALASLCLVFLGCTLLECSPHLSTTTQIIISVILI